MNLCIQCHWIYSREYNFPPPSKLLVEEDIYIRIKIKYSILMQYKYDACQISWTMCMGH